MSQLEHVILRLSDQEAIRIVHTIARAEAGSAQVMELTPEIRAALADAVPSADEDTGSPVEGDLARAALLWLGSDPARTDGTLALAQHPPAERFAEPGTIVLSAAVLILLQTHVRFERKPDGTWSLKVEKKPSSESLLKSLIQKLLELKS
jgi:hypothetical protein